MPKSSKSKLTKRTIDTLRPATHDYFAWDSELAGFGVRVRPNGKKAYVFQYRDAAGKSRRMRLGLHGELTVEQARIAATEGRAAALAARRDPSVPDPARQRELAKQSAESANAAPTVAVVADEFLSECEGKLKRSTIAEYRRLLGITTVLRGPSKGSTREGVLRRTIGREKVADVTRSRITTLHRSMADKPYMANRALAALSGLFEFAELHGYRPEYTNPCHRVAKFPEAGRQRLITADEYAQLGAALATAEREGLPVPPSRRRSRATTETAKHRTKRTGHSAPANPVAVTVLRFLLLSGWREGEALNLEWSHLDAERGVATLPSTKTGRSTRFLGTAALAQLERMREFRQLGNPFVFPGVAAGRPFTDTARLWSAARHAAGLTDVRLHDLRHGFASVGGDLGLSHDVVGALLGHTNGSVTAGYMHYFDSSLRQSADLISAGIAKALGGESWKKTPANEKTQVLAFRREA